MGIESNDNNDGAGGMSGTDPGLVAMARRCREYAQRLRLAPDPIEQGRAERDCGPLDGEGE